MMLLQLQIENIAIIEKLNITLYEGFNVLTGETGAGKSILIDSINALLGARVSREMIRSGSEKASVQGLFLHSGKSGNEKSFNEFLLQYGIDPQEDNTVLISRIIMVSGKNVCRVNGTLVTVGILRQIGQKLIDIYGQHENQSLLSVDSHVKLLDQFAGDKLLKEKEAYKALLEQYRNIERQIRELCGGEKERERTIDMLKYQIGEIEAAGLSPGEDESLEHQSKILSHAEDIIESFSKAYELIRGYETENQGALDKIGMSMEQIEKVQNLDERYLSVYTSLTDIYEKLTDLSREIRIIRDDMEYDPNLHKSIEERISLIQGLKRKYGETIPDILGFLEDSRNKLEKLEKSEELIAGLKENLSEIEKKLNSKCSEMNILRNSAAKILEEAIWKELNDLEMPGTKFSVSIKSCPDEGFKEDGTDSVEFLISTNPGEPLMPLSKIASGGEMSRIMLAMKTILADIDGVPSLIFDEIDTGVSGKAASKVGEKLKKLAKNHQVICITHHAQIACLADAHYFIEKKEKEGRTLATLSFLDDEGREKEITRLLSGQHATDAARSLARELLKSGQGGYS
jgi:DNA repair protein RecN (Recombination protein N)